MAQPADLVLVASDQSFHVASASSNAGGFSVWCPAGIFPHLTRHDDRLHFQPNRSSGASLIEFRLPFAAVEYESLATVRITNLSNASFLPGSHAAIARTLIMPALAVPFDLVIGWARRASVDSYVGALAAPAHKTYDAGDRVLVFAQVPALPT